MPLQRLDKDRTACSTEEDHRVLRYTRESFESRWDNVSKTTQTRRRQAEERFSLCKEFWNEYRTFVEWLDETEKALTAAISRKSGSGSPRSKLNIYEVRTVTQLFTMVMCIDVCEMQRKNKHKHKKQCKKRATYKASSTTTLQGLSVVRV